MQPKPKSVRRLIATPVNNAARTSVALRRIANKERAMLRTGRNRVKGMKYLRKLIRDMYIASLLSSNPSVSNYQRRAATPAGFKLSGLNLNKRLFRNNHH